MGKTQINHLLYRRQYLLVSGQIDCPFIHDINKVADNYTLYTHPDLVVNELKEGEKQLILLGDMFDYEDPQKGNLDILKDLAEVDFEAFLEMNAKYSGRYVIILVEPERMVLLHDATATRKVFYANRKGEYWFGSQPHLLARVMDIKRTSNPSKLKFYNSPDFILHNNANLGNTTIYDEIVQLMPNQFYNVNECKSVRYWPTGPSPQQPCKDVANLSTTIITGYMKSISNRYKMMLPVTAGGDSRLLMAATKDYHKNVLYYVNKNRNYSYDYKDIKTPVRLFEMLGLNFIVASLPTRIDPEFKKIYYENNPTASKRYLPHIFNYYKKYSDLVNLPGNFASSPWGVYDLDRYKATTDELTAYYDVQKFDYVKDYYKNWMDDLRKSCNNCKLNVINLFYWEERIANWGNQISIDKDIAQDDINPFNSRILNELFLSVPLKYNNEPDRLLHKSIILNLWPELMKLPFNPSKRTRLMLMLARLGLFTPVSRVLYKLSLKNLFR